MDLSLVGVATPSHRCFRVWRRSPPSPQQSRSGTAPQRWQARPGELRGSSATGEIPLSTLRLSLTTSRSRLSCLVRERLALRCCKRDRSCLGERAGRLGSVPHLPGSNTLLWEKPTDAEFGPLRRKSCVGEPAFPRRLRRFHSARSRSRCALARLSPAFWALEAMFLPAGGRTHLSFPLCRRTRFRAQRGLYASRKCRRTRSVASDLALLLRSLINYRSKHLPFERWR